MSRLFRNRETATRMAELVAREMNKPKADLHKILSVTKAFRFRYGVTPEMGYRRRDAQTLLDQGNEAEALDLAYDILDEASQ